MHTILDERDKMKFDEELKNIEDNVIVVSKSGEVLNVNDGADEPLKGLRVFGKTEQKSFAGNQLLRYPFVQTSKVEDGITFTDNGDGSVHLKGTATPEAYFNFWQNTDGKRLELKAGTYTISASAINAVKISGTILDADGNHLVVGGIFLNSNCLQVTVTIDKDGEMFLYVYADNGITVDETVHVMINKGSTALPWEPYVGGVPSPNPEYPQELVSVGNSGNVEVGVYGKNIAEFQYMAVNANYLTIIRFKEPIKLIKGEIYTISVDLEAPSDTRAYWNVNSGIYSQMAFTVKAGKNRYYYTFTALRSDVGTNVALLSKSANSDGITITPSNCQLECGSVTTEYEPYNKQSLHISTPNGLPGIKVKDASIATYTDENGQMWCADEVDLERGVYIKKIIKRVLDGSVVVGWFTTGGQVHMSKNALFGVETELLYPKKQSIGTYVMSDMFTVQNVSYMCDGVYTKTLYYSTDGTTFAVNANVLFETQDDAGFKKFFSEHPTTIYAILATPIETPLSQEELEAYKTLKMNYPNTTILNDANAHMEVKYIADVQNHIEQNYVSKAEYEAAMSQVSMIETAML